MMASNVSKESARIFAIGDIHGCYNKLSALMARLPYDPDLDTLVFLGDYINRGRQSREVLSFIGGLKRQGRKVVTLLGNHEHVLLQYARTGDETLFRLLRELDVKATVESYGGTYPASLMDMAFLPVDHRQFFEGLQPYWETEDFIFVHAGLLSGVPLPTQDIEALTGVREIFLADEFDFGKRVVFGHTPFATPLVTPFKIGIDTGAVYGNLLTALELPAMQFYHA